MNEFIRLIILLAREPHASRILAYLACIIALLVAVELMRLAAILLS